MTAPEGSISPEYSSQTITVAVDEADQSRSESRQKGPGLTFHDVSYEVKALKCARKSCLQREHKLILNSVSGMLLPGLNAIMGPTGSGKTTLLDVLADRKASSGITGYVLVNGERRPRNFRCISGYVVQEDIVMGTLTVKENLQFSAALRLPSHMTRSQRKERVEKVIAELGLQNCANTKLGTEFIRGVSGGERRRTSIGIELIIEPQVLFLDEPTTGLDAHTAVSVIELLKQLSMSSERIVIMSIHQPRYSIFKLFDTLTLLSRGDLVYHGPSRMALGYFDKIGFECEEHENPADYLLDVISQCENKEENHMKRSHVEMGISSKGEALSLTTAYCESVEHKRMQEVLTPILDNVLQQETHTVGNAKWWKGATYATNFLWQFLIVTGRSALNLVRNPLTSVFQMVATLIFAVMLTIIFFRISDRVDSREDVVNTFYDRLGAMFFIIMNQVFLNLSALDLFIKQRLIFMHENVSGFYRTTVYFWAKVFTDIIPMRCIPLFVYSVIVYFGVGFQADAGKFFTFLLTLILVSLSAAAIVFAISARVQVVFLAILMCALVFVLSILFGGFFVALDSIPVWVRWLKWLSIFRYGVEALAINEMSGLYCYGIPQMDNSTTFECSNSLPEQLQNITCNCFGGMDSVCCEGSSILELKGYETSTASLWYSVLGLAGLLVLFMTLAYISLRLIKKEK